MAESNDKPTIQQVWFNISEAAEYIGVSHDTLRRWEKKGKLVPRRTVGKHRRYSKIQLENVLQRPSDKNIKQIEKDTQHIKTSHKISIEPQITKIVSPEIISSESQIPIISTSQKKVPYQPQIKPFSTSPSTLPNVDNINIPNVLVQQAPQPQISTPTTPQKTNANILNKLKETLTDTVSLIILVVILILIIVSFFLLKSIQQPKTETTLSPIPAYNEIR